MNIRLCLAVIASGAVSAGASGAVINVSDIGGGVVLSPCPLTTTLFGEEQTDWSTSSLAAVHASVSTSGIDTNGRITILAADTGHGLALMALIDQQSVEGVSSLGHVRMDTVANGTSFAYMNDESSGVTVTPNGPSSRTASGTFEWNSQGGGDGFAWAGLVTGNTMTFRFNRIDGVSLGLNDPATFQFLTWEGTTWTAIDVPVELLSFTDTNDFGFAAAVFVPAPSLFVVAGMSALGCLRISRRRAGS